MKSAPLSVWIVSTNGNPYAWHLSRAAAYADRKQLKDTHPHARWTAEKREAELRLSEPVADIAGEEQGTRSVEPSLSPGLRREVVEAARRWLGARADYRRALTQRMLSRTLGRLATAEEALETAVRALSAPPAATDREDDNSSNGSEAVAPSPSASKKAES